MGPHQTQVENNGQILQHALCINIRPLLPFPLKSLALSVLIGIVTQNVNGLPAKEQLEQFQGAEIQGSSSSILKSCHSPSSGSVARLLHPTAHGEVLHVAVERECVAGREAACWERVAGGDPALRECVAGGDAALQERVAGGDAAAGGAAATLPVKMEGPSSSSLHKYCDMFE